jgi:hypothetical protein
VFSLLCRLCSLLCELVNTDRLAARLGEIPSSTGARWQLYLEAYHVLVVLLSYHRLYPRALKDEVRMVVARLAAAGLFCGIALRHFDIFSARPCPAADLELQEGASVQVAEPHQAVHIRPAPVHAGAAAGMACTDFLVLLIPFVSSC